MAHRGEKPQPQGTTPPGQRDRALERVDPPTPRVSYRKLSFPVLGIELRPSARVSAEPSLQPGSLLRALLPITTLSWAFRSLQRKMPGSTVPLSPTRSHAYGMAWWWGRAGMFSVKAILKWWPLLSRPLAGSFSFSSLSLPVRLVCLRFRP